MLHQMVTPVISRHKHDFNRYDAFGNALGNSIVQGLQTSTTKQNVAKALEKTVAKAQAQGATSLDQKQAFEEALSHLSPAERKQVQISENDSSLTIGIGGQNDAITLAKGVTDIGSLRSQHESLLGFIGEHNLYGNSQALNVSRSFYDKRTNYYSQNSVYDRVFAPDIAKGMASYNFHNRDSIAFNQRFAQNSSNISAMNQRMFDNQQFGIFERGTEILGAVGSRLSASGIDNIKGIFGYGDMSFREDLATILTGGRYNDSSYIRKLSNMDGAKLSAMSTSERFETQFQMFVTGSGPSNVTYFDGDPTVESLRNTTSAGVAQNLFYSNIDKNFAGNIPSDGTVVADGIRGRWGYFKNPFGEAAPFGHDVNGINAMMTLDGDQHYVGGWRINTVSTAPNNQVQYNGSNSTSFSSFTPWPAANYTDSGPFSNFKQTFIWNEDLK